MPDIGETCQQSLPYTSEQNLPPQLPQDPARNPEYPVNFVRGIPNYEDEIEDYD